MSIQRAVETAEVITVASGDLDLDLVVDLLREFGDTIGQGSIAYLYVTTDVTVDVQFGYSTDGGTTFLLDGHRYRVYPTEGRGFVVPPHGTHLRATVHRLAADATVNVIWTLR